MIETAHATVSCVRGAEYWQPCACTKREKGPADGRSVISGIPRLYASHIPAITALARHAGDTPAAAFTRLRVQYSAFIHVRS